MLLNLKNITTEVKKFHLRTLFTWHSDLTEKQTTRRRQKPERRGKKTREIKICVCFECYLESISGIRMGSVVLQRLCRVKKIVQAMQDLPGIVSFQSAICLLLMLICK